MSIEDRIRQAQMVAGEETSVRIPRADDDNHHNAIKCPYCNPQRLALVDPSELIALRAALDELIYLKDMKEEVANLLAGDLFLAKRAEYLNRQPLAWAVARKLRGKT
jgi:hypothetical protein